jgi:lipoprotein-anchoring transpeptidase ErfK/SrfK
MTESWRNRSAIRSIFVLMPRKYLISLIAVAGFFVMLVGGAYAYDSATSRTIAPGITVGGFNVGGMTAEEAQGRLRQDLLGELETPVIARLGDRSWRLGPWQSKVGVDIDGSVEAALARTNGDNFVVRAFRKISGSSLDASVEPAITFSAPAVKRFTARVAKEVDRPATDASLAFTVSAVEPVPSKSGVAIKRGRLNAEVTRALSTPGANRSIKVAVRNLKPKVTTKQLASTYPVVITVDRSNFRLTLFKDLKAVKSYPIAVGQAGLETPAGLYSIQSKQVNPSWYVPNSDWAGDLAGTVVPPGPDNPLRARWMGITAGAGIHGTSEPASLGSAASHGCVRMAVPDVIDLYDRVGVGTPVFIA